jgi:PAS domain S-box-containing protein
MENQYMNLSAATELRRRAEVQLKAKYPDTRHLHKSIESQRLNHELQVHQVELEMQNAELRQSRDEAEKSLEKYAELYDFAQVSYFTLTRNGDISNVNFRAASYLGVDRSKLLGRRFGQFVTVASRPAFSAFLSTAFSSSDKASCEVTFLKRGNLPLFAQIEAVAITSGQKCQIAVTDISELKQTEQSLRVSEELFRILSDNSPVGIALHDRELRHLYVNPTITKITGLPLETFLGKTVEEIGMPSEAAAQLDSLLRTVLETGLINNGELVFPANDGPHYFAWRSVPIFDARGSVNAVLAIASDITDLKRAEDTLRVANDELETRVRGRTMELAASVVILREEISERKRMEESLLRLNRLYAVVGETNQAIVRAGDRDSLFRDFCRIAVDQGGFLLSSVGLLDMESGQVRSVASYGATDYLNDIRFSAKDEPIGGGPTGKSIREGTHHICNDFMNASCTEPWHERGHIHGIKASASVPLRDKGTVIGALTLYAGEKDFFDPQHVDLLVQMGADVSFALDNLARETCRQQAEETLRKEILERLQAVELLRAKEQMFTQQSRLAGMGEMINNIAHQWRQPLNVLGLTVQRMRLLYDMGNCSKEFMDSSVNKSMGLIKHMSQTINDFMDFFKPEKEKVEFTIHEVVVRTVSLIEDNFKSQQVRIDLKANANPIILGFPNEYSQALLNILTNARDALLELRPDDATITVTISKKQGKSVVTVSDNAGGIAKEVLEKIFDPYFTTKGPDKGTGVGLFMSKSIIEKNMNGKLTARNTAKGAEFRIEV